MRSAACLAFFLAACGSQTEKSDPAATTPSAAAASPASAAPAAPVLLAGETMLAVPGGRIFVKETGSGSGTPMVLLHGGPGAGSFYLKPFEQLGDDRRVIRYDQLGAGRSDRLTDTSLMNIPHFVAELDSLRAAMHVQKWHLNSQSWGTVLALEYWKAHPERVASIVFGSPVFDWQAYQREARAWLPQLSDSAQRIIREADKSGKFDTPAYKAATQEYYSKFVFRQSVPADADSTFAMFGQPTYERMQGPNEFTITGTLKDYNRTAWLSQIKVPVLVTAGQFDEVGPTTVQRHAAMIPGARFVLYPGAAHLTSWDAPGANVKDVREFLRSADKAKR